MSAIADSLSRREFVGRLAKSAGLGVAALGGWPGAGWGAPSAAPEAALGFPGVWGFALPKGALILVSDEQLDQLQEPDREVDLSLSSTPNKTTLRRVCQETQAAGGRTLILAFDEFWSQYRAGQGGKPRALTPDTEEYVARVQRISQTLKAYGLGLELSLLSPLEIGPGYTRQTGEAGQWVQYREGWRDPSTGRFGVPLWEHLRWTNNKGTIQLARTGVRAFAFSERRVGRSHFYAVDPSKIIELKEALEIEAAEPAAPNARLRRMTVRGRGDTQLGALDRVLVAVSYRTPELDYFSPQSRPFLENLVRRYHQAGVPLNGLYADEMHIQQDWAYDAHHDEGQFTLRYLTPHLARRYAELYGAEFADFQKLLVYFACDQHRFLPNLEARLPAQHVLGDSPEAIHRTALLRRRYFDLLERTVVDLFAGAKRFAEKLYGQELEARAHATWAQSPTIDFWRAGDTPHAPRQYEYTANFLWSNTVHQAASACSDYFRWNDFLTGGGNDHAEGGWADRDYYGLALACSTGILNRTPNAYAAAWGMPEAVLRRHQALQDAFGAAASPPFQAIAEGVHRDVEVLMLYPLSLVAADERFGSWLVQYGYANYVTPDQLLARGRVTADGWVEMAGRRFRTVAVLFEPLPPAGLLEFLETLASKGGTVVWSGPPPRLDLAGASVLERWQRLFGVKALGFRAEGLIGAGWEVGFEGVLERVARQTVLTDLLVDLVYPVEPEAAARVVARANGQTLGIHRPLPGGGAAVFLGFRPRDDQAASLGHETRTWFDVLDALGAYPRSRTDLPVNDNPSVVSRQSPYLATRFPNGAVVVAAHYRRHVESWPGGFHRKPEEDAAILARNPLPSDGLELKAFAVAGHQVDYRGALILAFRLDAAGRLIAFGGHDCARIKLDDHEHVFADQPLAQIAWAPVTAERRVPGGARLELWVRGEGQVRVPLAEPIEKPRLHFHGGRPGSVGDPIAARVENGQLVFEARGNWGQNHLLLLPGA